MWFLCSTSGTECWIIWGKVESNKEHIAAALETLKPTSSWGPATPAEQGIEGVTMGGCGFGAAMDALIKYLGTEHGVTFPMGKKPTYSFFTVLWARSIHACNTYLQIFFIQSTLEDGCSFLNS